MNGFFIAGYVLFGIMAIIGGIYLYTLYMYSKHTLFAKTKYNPLTFAFYGLVFVILVVMGSLFLTTLKTKLENENNTLHAILCFVFAFLTIINCICYVIIIKNNNKNKIELANIPKTDFKPGLEKIKTKIGDVTKVKVQLMKHHKKYLSMINEASKSILMRLKDQNISKPEKYADIVEFNNAFSHKWCILPNNYQLLLTYEFLTLI